MSLTSKLTVALIHKLPLIIVVLGANFDLLYMGFVQPDRGICLVDWCMQELNVCTVELTF